MTTTRGLVSGLVVMVAGVGSVAQAAAADSMRGMLLKYVARCALAEGQFLEEGAGAGDPGSPRRYPGSLGLGPEWLDGTCDADCQERVSSCLIALSNRTGKHVELSLLSGAPGTSELHRGSSARFARVDFGAVPGAVTQLVLAIEGRRPGRVEALLDGRRLLGSVALVPGGAREQVIALPPHRIAGSHTVALRVVAGRDLGRLRALELRGTPARRIASNRW